jgi:hypothetical protein
MARKMRKFSDGGALGKYNRRMADIEKDFKKDSAGKSGRALEVLEAKRMQRKADAEDDRAKRTGGDRTATRKAEFDAEKNLSRTRKFGADKPAAAAEPAKTSTPAAAATPVAEKAKPQSFAAAFKDARSRLGAGKTFTYNGKSFTTNIAGEGRKRTNNSASTAASTPVKAASTPVKAASTPVKAASTPVKAASTPVKAASTTVATKVQGPSTKGPLNPNSIAGMISRGSISNPFKGLRLTNDADMRAYYKQQIKERAEGKAKGGKINKEKTMKKMAKGGSTPPQPTAAERKADAKFRESVKKEKVTPENAAAIGRGNRSEKRFAKGGVTKEMPSSNQMGSLGMAKGGKAKMKPAAKAKGKPFAATKFGAAMMKKSADTKGRAMPKFAKGGSIDGCAVRGKTKGKMMAMGGMTGYKKGGKTC